jgi:hypothetical protein
MASGSDVDRLVPSWGTGAEQRFNYALEGFCIRRRWRWLAAFFSRRATRNLFRRLDRIGYEPWEDNPRHGKSQKDSSKWVNPAW